MKISYLSNAVLCFVMFAINVAWGDELQAVRFAPEKDYGPFVYQDDAGRIKGLSIDMLASIGKAAGLTVETLPARSLSEILAMVRRGEVDLVSSLRPNPERAQYLDFTRPYVSVPAILLRRAGANATHTLGELSGISVAVGKGYAVEAYVRAKFPAIKWVAFPDDVAALGALQNGKVEGVVADVASANFAIWEHGFKDLQVGGPVGFEYPLSFGFRKDRPDIGEALERGLRALRPEERDAILARWLNAQTLTVQDARADRIQWIAMSLALVAMALLFFAALQRRFRHRVE